MRRVTRRRYRSDDAMSTVRPTAAMTSPMSAIRIPVVVDGTHHGSRQFRSVNFAASVSPQGQFYPTLRETLRRTNTCRKWPGLNGCGRVTIHAPELEDFVRDLLCGMLADP